MTLIIDDSSILSKIDISVFCNFKIDDKNNITFETIENKNMLINSIINKIYNESNNNLFTVIMNLTKNTNNELYFNHRIIDNILVMAFYINLMINENRIESLFKNVIFHQNDEISTTIIINLIIKLTESNIINTSEYINILSKYYITMCHYDISYAKQIFIFLLLENTIFEHFISNSIQMSIIKDYRFMLEKLIKENKYLIVNNKYISNSVYLYFKGIYQKNISILETKLLQ